MHPAHHYRIHLWDRSRGKLGTRFGGELRAIDARVSPHNVAHAAVTSIRDCIVTRTPRAIEASHVSITPSMKSGARLMPDEIPRLALNRVARWLARAVFQNRQPAKPRTRNDPRQRRRIALRSELLDLAERRERTRTVPRVNRSKRSRRKMNTANEEFCERPPVRFRTGKSIRDPDDPSLRR